MSHILSQCKDLCAQFTEKENYTQMDNKTIDIHGGGVDKRVVF